MRVPPSVSALLVRPLVAALAGSPPALESFFGATDLTHELLADADARVSPAQFCVAWAELVRLSGDPRVALRIAAGTPAGSFGVVEYLCRCAPTLGAALAQWVRYLNLLNDAVTVGLLREGDRAFVRVLTESEAPAPASHELCFALLAGQIHALSAVPVRVTAVEFTHRAGDPSAYERALGTAVRFGAEHTQLALPASALDAPLRTVDANLHALLTRVADEQHAKAASAPPLTMQVRRVLQQGLRDNDAGVEQVAKKLGLTARSLQRRLKDEGASFQTVREGLRRELATRYLDDELSITEISFLLGFSEPSAFFRAFKRWTGSTPIESRARMRGAATAG